MDARRPRAKPLSAGRSAVWIACALGAIVAFGFGRLPGELRDFEVYWTAAARALQAEPLYREADGHYQFKYLPAFAVVTAPVALLPLAQAKAAWFVASVVLLVQLVALSLAILPERRRPAWAIVLVLVVTMGKFYGHELVLGQVNLLFGVVVTAAIVMMRQRRDVVAAVLLVCAVAVKPYAVVFLPWLAWVRGRTALVAVVSGLAALVALPVALYGISGTAALHAAWWRTVTGSTAPNLTNSDNVSVAGMFAKWLGIGPPASVATLAVTGVLVALVVLVIARRDRLRGAEALEGALLLALIPLISPQGWDYVFLIATPAVAVFANYDDRLPAGVRSVTWIALIVIGLSLFDLMGRERYALFMSWSVITICFIVLVSTLFTLRMRRDA